jgi:hypothetical protein
MVRGRTVQAEPSPDVRIASSLPERLVLRVKREMFPEFIGLVSRKNT